MIGTRFASLLALPVLSAGILSGAALGLAGAANATVTISNNGSTVTVTSDDSPISSVVDDDSTDDSTGGGSFNASPNEFASPAPNLVPWAQWINEGNNSQDMYGAVVGTDANP